MKAELGMGLMWFGLIRVKKNQNLPEEPSEPTETPEPTESVDFTEETNPDE